MDYEETPTQRYCKKGQFRPTRLLDKILREEAKLAKQLNPGSGGCCLETQQGTPKLQGFGRKLKRRSFSPRQLFPGPESTQRYNPTSYEPSPLRRDSSPLQNQYSPEQYGASPVQYQGSRAQYAATPYPGDYDEYDQSQLDQSYAVSEARSLPPNRTTPVSRTYRCCFHSAPATQTYRPEEESPIYDHYVQSPEFDEYVPSPTSPTCPHYPEGDPYTTPVQYHQLNTSDEYPEEQVPYDPLDNFEHFKQTIIAALNKDQEEYASLMHFLNSEDDIERFHELFLDYKDRKTREQGYF